MKILLFIDNLGAGGAQRQLVGLAVMLKQRGYQVKVCYYQDTPFYASMLDENDVPHELIQGSDNHKKRIPVVARYFKKERPNWVIAYQETPSLVACAAKLLGGGFKLIVSERNTTQKVGMNERVRFFLYRWADAIVPNSYSQMNYLITKHSWMKNKIKTIVNFVDLDIFHPVYHKRHNVPEILVVGSIGASKNTKRFIQACKLLKDKNVKFKASWFGWRQSPSEYMIEAKKMVGNLGLSDEVSFKEKTLNIAPEYNKADYYCMPSVFEGTPNVLCEAIASGMPVVSSDVCDNHLYAIENFNGFMFDYSSVEDMACAMEKILSISDEQYEEFCHASRRLAEEKLNSEKFINSYLQIIEC